MISPFAKGIIVGALCTIGCLASITHASSGGLFGDIIGKILGITPSQVLTYTGDGTVANASSLGGVPATNYQKIAPNQSCGAGKCIYGFDVSGNVMCR